MRYLIDTHVLIWYINGDKTFPVKYIELLEDSHNTIYISTASLWEMAIKLGLKKLDLNMSFEEIENYISSRDFKILDISFEHLKQLLSLPRYHGDPFDRLIISQAIIENLSIMSVDSYFTEYPVTLA